jgi:hypothetical protein
VRVVLSEYRNLEKFGNCQTNFHFFWQNSHFSGKFATSSGNVSTFLGEICPKKWEFYQNLDINLGDSSTSENTVIRCPMTVHMRRTDVTDGALERAFTALVYNGASNGLWHTILLNLKNQMKTGGLAGRPGAGHPFG